MRLLLNSSAISRLILWFASLPILLHLAAPLAASEEQLSRYLKADSTTTLVLDDTVISDEDLLQLEQPQFRSLEVISLRRTRITDAGVRSIRNVPNLRSLDLSGTQISDGAAPYLKQFFSLESLSLANSSISDTSLYHLKDMSLKKLDLGGTKVSDRGVLYLKNMRGLYELHLGGTSVSNQAIVHLRGLPIERLDLRLTNIDSGALDYLKNLPLRELIVWDTKMSAAAISDLKRAFPSIRINGNDF